MSSEPALSFSVSATTRAPRTGERDGVDYHFLQEDRFRDLLAEDAFLEHATVYGRSYGTLKGPTLAALRSGQSLVLDIDVRGSEQVRSVFPEAVHIIIVPPTMDALHRRLVSRATDSREVIEERMRLAAEQLLGMRAYDYVVVNDDLDRACATLAAIVRAEHVRTGRQGSVIERVLCDIGSMD
jgi:guanylate kinase